MLSPKQAEKCSLSISIRRAVPLCTSGYGITEAGSLCYAERRGSARHLDRDGALSLVPSGPVFAEARQRFSGVLATELLARCFRGLKAVGRRDRRLSPSLDMLTLNALRVSRYVAIPVEANRLALKSVQQTLETVALARQDNRVLEMTAVIVCRSHPRRRIHREVVSELEKTFPDKNGSHRPGERAAGRGARRRVSRWERTRLTRRALPTTGPLLNGYRRECFGD